MVRKSQAFLTVENWNILLMGIEWKIAASLRRVTGGRPYGALVAAVGAATRHCGWWDPARHLARWWAPVAPPRLAYSVFKVHRHLRRRWANDAPKKPPTTRQGGRFFICPPWRVVALTLWAPIWYRLPIFENAPKSRKLRAPKSRKLRAPKSRKLRAPKSRKYKA
jgi:hypothetical protein